MKLTKKEQKRKDKGPKMDLKFCLVITQEQGTSRVEVNQAFSPPLGIAQAGKQFEQHNIGDLVASVVEVVEAAVGEPVIDLEEAEIVGEEVE